jgi:hypothetical protein
MSHRRMFKLFAIASMSMLGLTCVALTILFRLSGPPGYTTDVSAYPAIRASFEDSPLVQHFPPAIPADATNVRLDYLPRLMQGGMHFQLRLTLPPHQIDELYQHFQLQATHHFAGGHTTIHQALPDGIPTTEFYTSEANTGSTGLRAFPATYEVLVLNAEPGGSAEYIWNHGHSYGVAIDRTTSTIVYWTEYW